MSTPKHFFQLSFTRAQHILQFWLYHGLLWGSLPNSCHWFQVLLWLGSITPQGHQPNIYYFQWNRSQMPPRTFVPGISAPELAVMLGQPRGRICRKHYATCTPNKATHPKRIQISVERKGLSFRGGAGPNGNPLHHMWATEWKLGDHTAT